MSAKVEALLEFLDATRAKDRRIKTVVFSQWTMMLNIVEVRAGHAGA
jgi:SWI/SNF-related matrix-associated actin-dependent regulator of chromatin subfamily A3